MNEEDWYPAFKPRYRKPSYKLPISALGMAAVGYEFDGLRADPRFQDLVRRMNFPQ